MPFDSAPVPVHCFSIKFKPLPVSSSLAGYTGSAGIPLSGRKQRKKTNMIHLKIGACNVLMLMDSARSDRPKEENLAYMG